MIGYIYKITNLLNDRVYIGKRQSSKFDNAYWGSGKVLKLAYKKYGRNNFKREIICWCETLEELNKQEIYWIKWYRDREFNCYNITNGGDGCLGLKYWLGKNLSEEHKNNISKSHLGVKKPPRTEEHRKHLSESHMGMKFSNEHKKNISIAKSKKVIVDDKLIFDSLTSCAKYLNIFVNNLSMYLKKGVYKTHKLRYFTEENKWK